MIVWPAIDVREGACVQLVGGDYHAERVRLPDPLRQARAFREAGFSRLHVVDLDAATGRGDNAALVESLLADSSLRVQVGGGLRTIEAVSRWIDRGADRVVVGTRAVEDSVFREELARRFPDRVVIAVDVREREVLVRGWAEGTGKSIYALATELAGLPLAGLLVTAVHKEGRLGGPDVDLYRTLDAEPELSITASGGVSTSADLKALRDAGCDGVVIGMALYTGALDPRAVAAEYDQ